MTTTTNLRRRVEQSGFVLLELKRINARRFLVIEPDHGLVIRGNDVPQTAEEVDRWIRQFEDDPFTAEPVT